jgi:hypothetical protein
LRKLSNAFLLLAIAMVVAPMVSALSSASVGTLKNLGASQVCDSSVDFKCFGYYYQWGRNDDGHEYKGGEGLPSVKLASSFIDAGTFYY